MSTEDKCCKFVLDIDDYGQYSPKKIFQSDDASGDSNDNVEPAAAAAAALLLCKTKKTFDDDNNDDDFSSADTVVVDGLSCRCEHDYRTPVVAKENVENGNAPTTATTSCCQNDQTLLVVMMSLTLLFAVCELLFGFLNDSLALVADSFHMLSDAAALVIAMIAMRLATRPEKDQDAHSFGWQRAEIIGALVNGVYLVSVCIYNVLESIFRIIEPAEIRNAWTVLVVGAVGFAINLIGFGLFFSHRSLATHAGHSHSHSHHDDNHGSNRFRANSVGNVNDNNDDDVDNDDDKDDKINSVERAVVAGSSSANMHGVFLHIMGDLLGSVIVIATALATIYVPYQWRVYFDPVCTILFSFIILRSSLPLIRHSSAILMQSTPPDVPLPKIRRQLLQIDKVRELHELHVWQMVPRYYVASVHLIVDSLHDSRRIIEESNKLFCRYNIHRTTLQLEE